VNTQYIIKRNVCNGVYYVDIPSADVRILCSSPADVVKHLIRKTIIRPYEKDGVETESGPNIILLSDLHIQNGQLSNLSEFPVLQMLYKQGMIIPNHPNNTGDKPLILGSKTQVKSQLEYIYRGNYGLTTLEEMMQGGLSEDESIELLKLKLKFAFGEFKTSDKLLDSKYIDESRILIKNDVYIERTDINIFRITYEPKMGDTTYTYSIDIDLNLKLSQKYESPYVLGHSFVDRDYLSIVYSGEGDGWNPLAPSMSGIVVYQGKVYLIDAGANIENTLMSLGIGLNEIEGIFHTHAHDDHFCGIVSLMELDHKIKYYATPLIHLSVMKKLSALLDMEDSKLLEKFFDFIPLVEDEWNNINGLEVKPIFSPHPIETTAFIFRCLNINKQKSYYHMADISSFKVLDNMLIKNPNDIGITQKRLDKVKKDYLIPADIKKIDAGEGMIHGSFEDFKNDTSSHIVLAHTSDSLSIEQKMLGSEVYFGTSEVLIDKYFNLGYNQVNDILRTYFTKSSDALLLPLLNNPIKKINPRTIIYRNNTKIHTIYLIITGVVSTISDNPGNIGHLSVGSFIGELEFLNEGKSKYTYRSESYVNLLCIPVSIFKNFINVGDLKEQYIKMKKRRIFLQYSTLFKDFLSGKVKSNVANNLEIIKINKGSIIEHKRFISIVYDGEVELKFLDSVIDIIKKGDFFGEKKLIFNARTLLIAKALSDVTLYTIPFFAIEKTPMIVKKCLERVHKNHQKCLREVNKGNKNNFLYWNDSFESNIQTIDRQTEKVIELINVTMHIFNNLHLDNIDTLSRSIYNLEFSILKNIEYQKKEMKRYSYSNLQNCQKLNDELADVLKDIYRVIRNTKTIEEKNQKLLQDKLILLKSNFTKSVLGTVGLKKEIKNFEYN